MRKSIIASLLILIFCPAFLFIGQSSPSFMKIKNWALNWGGAYYDWVCHVYPLPQGGYIVAGDTQNFGLGKYESADLWVLKLSDDGEVEWQKTYGTGQNEKMYDFQLVDDNGFIVLAETAPDYSGENYFERSFFLLKLNSVGNIEWQFRYKDIWPYSVRPTPDGGYILGATTSFSGHGSNDYLVLKLSSQGGLEWQRTYGAQGVDVCRCVIPSRDGGYVALGESFIRGLSGGDIWILKLTSSGDVEWQYAYGSDLDEDAASIDQASDGGYLVGGTRIKRGQTYSESYYDFWVLKIDSAGTIKWQKTYTLGQWNILKQVRATPDGGWIALGHASGQAETAWSKMWVLKLNSQGDIQWQNTYDGFYGRGMSSASIEPTEDKGYIIGAGTIIQWSTYVDFLVLKVLPRGGIMATGQESGLTIDVSHTLPLDTEVSPFLTSMTPLGANVEPSAISIVPMISAAQTRIQPVRWSNPLTMGKKGGAAPRQ